MVFSPPLLSVSLLLSPHCLFPCAGGNPNSCLTAVDEVRHYVTGSERARQPALTSVSMQSSNNVGTEWQAGRQAGRGHIQYLWSLCSINSSPALLQYGRQHLVNGCVENILPPVFESCIIYPPPSHRPKNKEVEYTVQYIYMDSRNKRAWGNINENSVHCLSNQKIRVELSRQMWEWISSECLLKSVTEIT